MNIRILLAFAVVSCARADDEPITFVERKIDVIRQALVIVKAMPEGPDRAKLLAAITAGLDLAQKVSENTLSTAMNAADAAGVNVFGSGQKAFAAWAKRMSQNTSEVELNPVQIAAMWGQNDTIPLMGGIEVKPDQVIWLSPSGLKYRSDKGIEVASFRILPAALATLTGWDDSIAERYSRMKAQVVTEGNSSAVRAAHPQQERAATHYTPSPSAPNRERASNPIAEAMARRSASATTSPVPSDVLQDIVSAAIKEWPGDYSMQEYESKNQVTAWRRLQAYKSGVAGVPDSVLSPLIQAGEKEWGKNYEMIVYDIKNQLESYAKMHGLK